MAGVMSTRRRDANQAQRAKPRGCEARRAAPGPRSPEARSSSAEFASRFSCDAPEAGHLARVHRVDPRLRDGRQLKAPDQPLRDERPAAILLHEVAAHLEV